MSELERPGATLYYSDSGPRSAPAVVFGHGLLFSSSMFHHQIDALNATFRCVSVDWRGHGLSRARGEFTIDDIGDDLEALIEHVGAPVHYVGHSMGAYVALPLAAERPELFRSLTLVGASANAEDPDVAARYHRFAAIYRTLGKSLVAQRVKDIMFSTASLRNPRVKRDIEHWVEEIGYPARGQMRRAILAVANRHGAQLEASNITVPTQIIAGDEDAANPIARSHRLKELIPHAPLHTLRGVGHVAPLEAPNDVTRLLKTFFWQAARVAA